MRKIILTLCLVLAGTTSLADDTTVAGITISDVWARATPKSARTGAAYLTLHNKGASDRLVGAATPAARTAEIHESSMQNGVMRMRRVNGIDVPTGGKAMLASGAYHIMLMGLKDQLKEGDSFPITLQFAKAGKVTVSATVKKIGAGGMSHGHDMKKDKKSE